MNKLNICMPSAQHLTTNVRGEIKKLEIVVQYHQTNFESNSIYFIDNKNTGFLGYTALYKQIFIALRKFK